MFDTHLPSPLQYQHRRVLPLQLKLALSKQLFDKPESRWCYAHWPQCQRSYRPPGASFRRGHPLESRPFGCIRFPESVTHEVLRPIVDDTEHIEPKWLEQCFSIC